MKSTMMARLLGILVVLSITSATSAFADTIALQISSGATSITVYDGGANDTNSTAGMVGYMGSVGSWGISISTGAGTPDLPAGDLQLNSVDMSTGDAGPLTVMFSEIDITSAIPAFTVSLNGTNTNDSTELTAYYSTSDQYFATDTQIGSTLGPYDSYTFSGTTGGAADGSPYSITEVLTITPIGTDPDTLHLTSGGADVVPAPEPTSLILIGSGILGLAIIRKRAGGVNWLSKSGM